MNPILLLRSLVLSLLFAPTVFAETAVIPATFENTESPRENAIPFGTDLFCDNGIRYQQVYTGGELPNDRLITAIRFRLNGFEQATQLVETFYGGTLITMSTAANGAGDLSNTFAENIGDDVAAVFDDDLILSAPLNGEIPRPFDVEIALQTPFDYRDGDLLVDIMIEECGDGDAFFDRADNSFATERRTARDINDTMANISSGPGLVTQFQLRNDQIFADGFEDLIFRK